MPTDPDLDLEQIASASPEATRAPTWKPLCREAALVCMRRTINLRDFEKRIALPPALGPLRHHLRLPHRHEAHRPEHPALTPLVSRPR